MNLDEGGGKFEIGEQFLLFQMASRQEAFGREEEGIHWREQLLQRSCLLGHNPVPLYSINSEDSPSFASRRTVDVHLLIVDFFFLQGIDDKNSYLLSIRHPGLR